MPERKYLIRRTRSAETSMSIVADWWELRASIEMQQAREFLIEFRHLLMMLVPVVLSTLVVVRSENRLVFLVVVVVE